MDALWLILLGAGWVAWQVLSAKPKGPRGKNRAKPASAVSGAEQSTGASNFAQGAERMRWSGISQGPLAIKSLTRQQAECLGDAADRQRVLPAPPSEIYDERPDGIAAHPTKTVQSLVKHGFLEEDGAGTFRVTDKGLHAYEALNTRY